MNSPHQQLLDHLAMACVAAGHDLADVEAARKVPRKELVAQAAMLLALGKRLLEQGRMPIADVPPDLEGT